MISNYLVSISNSAPKKKKGTIHDPATKLKVKVTDLVKSTYKPTKGEVSFFVTAGKQLLAFETQGYKRHRELLILQMVAWYCAYLGLIGAQIHSTLPFK
jgi:hypothetical protein